MRYVIRFNYLLIIYILGFFYCPELIKAIVTEIHTN